MRPHDRSIPPAGLACATARAPAPAFAKATAGQAPPLLDVERARVELIARRADREAHLAGALDLPAHRLGLARLERVEFNRGALTRLPFRQRPKIPARS